MLIKRKIIEIDEERCNGCGQCVLDCAEGALAIVDGKAKVISDHFCDGLGACLQGCPQDALHIVEREAAPFDEQAVHEHLHAASAEKVPAASAPRPLLAQGCAGSLAGTFASAGGASHWPVKLRLLPAEAPFLKGASLLLTADCAPAVFPGFHALAQGKVVATVCPKFEDVPALTQKLAAIFQTRELHDITALRMEVPCCQGLERMVREALRQSGATCPVASLCMGRNGVMM